MAVNSVLSVSAPFSLSTFNNFEPPLPITQTQTIYTCGALSLPPPPLKTHSLSLRHGSRNPFVFACTTATPSGSGPPPPKRSRRKLYVSGLSFRTTEESLRNAFKDFGQLVEVNLVMDKIANRPRGFAFLRYTTEEESQRAIEGMHGKFLDGRVIFVEVAKPRSELRQGLKHNPRQY